MAGSLNRAMLIGNLGRDPEIRSFQNGGRVANLSIATSETWRDKATGERKEKTEWHRVVIFNDKLVEVVEKYLAKGSKIFVEGQLETRKWTDQSGVERYITEVVVRPYRGSITLLDGRNRDAGDDRSESEPDDVSTGGRVHAGAADYNRQYGNGRNPILDDEIPF